MGGGGNITVHRYKSTNKKIYFPCTVRFLNSISIISELNKEFPAI